MSVIDELRREGDIFQAYELAKERLKAKPDQDLVKRDFGKVLTDLLQNNCLLAKSDQFFDYLSEFYAVKVPLSDSVIHENIMWQVGKFIKELTRAEAPSAVFDKLHQIIAHVELPSGTSLFTFIMSSVLEAKEFNNTHVPVLLNLRVRNLPANHFEAINDEGEKKPSLGELVLLTVAKELTNQKNPSKADIKILLEELDFVGEHYKNIPYINYYKAKAYNSVGDKENAVASVLAYLKRRSKEYLAWELLSDISDDHERKTQALCKTVTCHTRPGQLVRSQTKLFYILLKDKEFDVAKSLYKAIIEARRELGKHVTDEWKGYSSESWYKAAKPYVDFENYCYNRSKEVVAYVFSDWKAQTGVIYGLNVAKDLAEFVVADDVHGAYKFFGDKSLRVGDFVSLKLQRVANHEGVKHRALYVEKSTKRPKRTIYKVVEDEIRAEGEKYFVGSVPINYSYAEGKGFREGDIVRVKAVKLPSSRFKEEVKWKVLSLNEKGAK